MRAGEASARERSTTPSTRHPYLYADRAQARPRRRAGRRCWPRSRARSAVDCTFGAGGHARLHRRAARARRDADRHRPRPRRRGALRRASPTRLPARPASSAPTSRQGFVPCTAKASAQTWSTWTSECPRCRSTPGSGASPTPTTRRSTCGWTRARSFSAADLVNEWPESRIAAGAAPLRRGALRRRDRPRDRPPAPARDHLRAGRRDQGRDADRGALRRRPSRQAQLPGDPDRRQRRARLARRGAAAGLGACCRSAAGFGAISFHSLEDRPREAVPRRQGARLHLPARAAGLRLRPRARGRAADPPRRLARARRRSPPTRARARPTCAPR